MTLLVVAACGGGKDETAADGATEPTATEGRAFDLGNGVSVVVHEVIDPVSPDRDYEERYGIDVDPTSGFRFVAVDLEYLNDSDIAVELFFEYGTELRTSDGRGVDSATLETELMQDVPKTVPASLTARGWRAFLVPEGAELGTLLLYGKIGDEPVVVEL